jgi:hypothetical protein
MGEIWEKYKRCLRLNNNETNKPSKNYAKEVSRYLSMKICKWQAYMKGA